MVEHSCAMWSSIGEECVVESFSVSFDLGRREEIHSVERDVAEDISGLCVNKRIVLCCVGHKAYN